MAYKFLINNRTWSIEEVDKDWLLEEYKKEYVEYSKKEGDNNGVPNIWWIIR